MSADTVSVPASLYADGGVISVNPSPYGGTWAWCQVDDFGIRIRGESGVILSHDGIGNSVSNNVAELAALVFGLEALPPDWRGIIYSDSWVSLQRVFLAAALNNVPRWLVLRLQVIQKSGRLAGMRYVLLDGHPTKAQLAMGRGKRGNPVSEHNVWCDQACQKAAAFHSADSIIKG